MDAAKEVIQAARRENKTVCSCESLTAGLFCDLLGSVPGASAVLKGGLVTYFTQMKTTLAHVPESLIAQYGVVSAQCAAAMAANTREIMSADYCVSFTGNAGPDTMENKPAGLVYCAIATASQVYGYAFQYTGLSRNEVRLQVCLDMLERLETLIKKVE